MNLKQKISSSFPFGSILKTKDINDIDLTIIYDKTTLGVKEAVELRNSIRKYVNSFTDIEPNACYLLPVCQSLCYIA